MAPGVFGVAILSRSWFGLFSRGRRLEHGLMPFFSLHRELKRLFTFPGLDVYGRVASSTELFPLFISFYTLFPDGRSAPFGF